jgi:hypothetical protein
MEWPNIRTDSWIIALGSGGIACWLTSYSEPTSPPSSHLVKIAVSFWGVGFLLFLSRFPTVQRRLPLVSGEQRQRRRSARALIEEIHHNLSLSGRERYVLRREALDAFLNLMRGSSVEREEWETVARIRKLQDTMKLYEYDVSSGYPAQTIYGLYERSYKPAAQEAEKVLREMFMRR